MPIDYESLRNSLIANYSLYCDYLDLTKFFNQIANEELIFFENREYFFSKYPYNIKRRSIYSLSNNIKSSDN